MLQQHWRRSRCRREGRVGRVRGGWEIGTSVEKWVSREVVACEEGKTRLGRGSSHGDLATSASRRIGDGDDVISKNGMIIPSFDCAFGLLAAEQVEMEIGSQSCKAEGCRPPEYICRFAARRTPLPHSLQVKCPAYKGLTQSSSAWSNTNSTCASCSILIAAAAALELARCRR